MIVHLHLTVQPMPSGKWVGTIRREGHDMPFALTRPHDTRELAELWVLDQARRELASDPVDAGSAA